MKIDKCWGLFFIMALMLYLLNVYYTQSAYIRDESKLVILLGMFSIFWECDIFPGFLGQKEGKWKQFLVV